MPLPEWRLRLLRQLDIVLILFEAILSIVFTLLSYVRGSMYFRGVGVGLLVAWITSAIAYFFKSEALRTSK